MSSLPPLGRAVLDQIADRAAVPTYLDRAPGIGIVHFGVGNFHRSHQAMYVDRILGAGAEDWAICGIGLTEHDRRMAGVLAAQDGLYTLTLRHPDGTDEPSVIGSIRRYLHADDDADAVIEQLADPSVRIVSLTITEGGYLQGEVDSSPLVREEVDSDLLRPRTAFGFILAGLRRRRDRGTEPFTVMSCDNIQGNGRIARSSMLAVAERVDPALAVWVGENVSFPSTMVDRITPATQETDRQRVRDMLGVEDAWPVSAEPFEQWVLEDDFPAGRPPFEAVGATFTDDIDGYESAKLRLLNASHQAVAYVGQMAGYVHVHEALADARIRRFVERYMLVDAVGSFTPPRGLDVRAYCASVLERFANPAVADPLIRLSVDSSDRVPIFVVPVVADLRADDHAATQAIAVLASWYGYWAGVSVTERSSDRAAAQLIEAASGGPTDFVRSLPAVAGLADDEDFVAAFADAATLLDQSGVDAFLERFAPEGDR